ncbi:MAG: GNAT family N-acetyltransferase [Caldilineaceae bacterium]
MPPFKMNQAKLAQLGVTIEAFDVDAATDAQWRAINDLFVQTSAESAPEDPAPLLENTISGMRNVPPVIDLERWFVWQGDALVGNAAMSFMRTEENQHILNFDLFVLPGWRRRGLGAELLKLAVNQAQEKARTSLITNTISSMPDGEAFCQAIGAQANLTVSENQLVMDELDHALIQRWLDRASERADDLELGLYVGPFPESELEAIVAVHESMNSAPRDDLDVEDFHMTPAIMREIEASLTARDIERWVMFVRDPATGVYAGFTEVFWRPNVPDRMGQGDTGVVDAYRNRGIGRWLKAAMLKKIVAERPQVKYVRTGNAASNEPMLKINHELGFKLHKTFKVWQVERSQVEEFLQKHGD